MFLWACFTRSASPRRSVVIVAASSSGRWPTRCRSGRIGGVDGGIIGTFVVFGVDSGLALVGARLRAFSFMTIRHHRLPPATANGQPAGVMHT
jgi:hypothetical protein